MTCRCPHEIELDDVTHALNAAHVPTCVRVVDRVRALIRRADLNETIAKRDRVNVARQQSLRKRLDDTVTLWQGKFHAVRHENNALRRENDRLRDLIANGRAPEET